MVDDNTIERGAVYSEDNCSPGPPAIGLLTKAFKRGELERVDWKCTRYYKYAQAAFAVKEAQIILKDWHNFKIRGLWLLVEEICRQWRSENNVVVSEGQEYLPVQIRAYTNGFKSFKLARDADCFAYLLFERYPDAVKLIEGVGVKQYLAVMILYENHFGFFEDLLGSYASLKEYEQAMDKPNVVRGEATVEGGIKGQEKRFGTKEEKARQDAVYQSYIEALYKKNNRLSYERMCKQCAEHFGVSLSKIKRRTVNFTKKS